MPIVVQALPKAEFEKWLAQQQAAATPPPAQPAAPAPAPASTAAAPKTAAVDAPVSQGHQG